ncbi:hypothetical protein PV325_004836 [Microctonus aethiopoides]|nr:hypothetical protein PV325_004836 [Microctonus aethiopoides]
MEQVKLYDCGAVTCLRNFRTDFLEEWPTPGTGPHFDTSMPSNFTGLVGNTVDLVCKVKNLGNRTTFALVITSNIEACISIQPLSSSSGGGGGGDGDGEDQVVSWVRHRDIHLLTVGRYTYTSDQRFEAKHSPHTEEWKLIIRYPQRKDTGYYECQISTTPPIGHPVYLTIVGEKLN